MIFPPMVLPLNKTIWKRQVTVFTPLLFSLLLQQLSYAVTIPTHLHIHGVRWCRGKKLFTHRSPRKQH